LDSTLQKVTKILLWLLFLHTLIVTQTASANASPATVVKVEPATTAALVGENFIVDIALSDVQNLFGLEVTLNWNSTILQMVNADVRLGFESHPDGVLHEPLWKNETIEAGEYQLVATSLYRETPSFNGSGSIARITFNVTSAGSCELSLGTLLANKPSPHQASSPIAHTTINGFFSSTGPAPPTWPYVAILVAVATTTVVTVIVINRRRLKQLKKLRLLVFVLKLAS